MKKNEAAKKTLTEMFMTTDTPAAADPEPAAKPEPKKSRRKSIIDREPLPEKDPAPAAEKPKRKRRGKPPELKKTHSVTVYCTEQLYNRFKAVAERKELSVNGIITHLMRNYVEMNDFDIK